MAGVTTTSTNYNDGAYKEKKKGMRAFHVFRVAMHMLKKKKNEKKKQIDTDNKLSSISIPTNDTLSRFVGSVRPLHLQGNVGGLLTPPPPPPPALRPSDCSDGALVSPLSEVPFSYVACPSPSSSSNGGTMSSRYTSCQSLYDLGVAEEERMNDNMNRVNEEVDAYYDGLEGDEFIDSKAEMFITKFYNQMKLNPNISD